MWPTIFEFNWDTGHMIFLGVFYSVLIVIATSLVYVFARSIIDTFNGNTDVDQAEAINPRQSPFDKGES